MTDPLIWRAIGDLKRRVELLENASRSRDRLSAIESPSVSDWLSSIIEVKNPVDEICATPSGPAIGLLGVASGPAQPMTAGTKEMPGLTTDPADPRLTRGMDEAPVSQAPVYLVLSQEERAKGFVRPVRYSYKHDDAAHGCGTVTRMGHALSETYAREPAFYGSTYCCGCSMHRAVREFTWVTDGQQVGS